MASVAAEDLKKLSDLRCQEALTLYNSGSHSGAYYLSGYAVELALKAIISKQFKANVLPDKSLVQRIFSHNVDELTKIAGLAPKLKMEQDRNADFHANWAIMSEWGPDSRYAFADPFKAGSMIMAVTSEPHGVLPWLKKHW